MRKEGDKKDCRVFFYLRVAIFDPKVKQARNVLLLFYAAIE